LQDDFDYTSADNQKLLYDYHHAFLKIDNIVKKEDGSLPDFWLQEFRSWLLGTVHKIVISSKAELTSFYDAMLCKMSVCPSICLSVRTSVRPSHAGIVSKRLHISSKFFHLRGAPPFYFFRTKRYGNILTGTPITGASNARGYEKITISTNISLYLGNDAR